MNAINFERINSMEDTAFAFMDLVRGISQKVINGDQNKFDYIWVLAYMFMNTLDAR